MDRIEKLKEFLSTNPADAFLLHALALEYVKVGNDAEAQRLFQDLLQQHPEYVGSYYHLAKLFERNGETTEALGWYKKGMVEAKKVNDMHALNELRMAYEDLSDE